MSSAIEWFRSLSLWNTKSSVSPNSSIPSPLENIAQRNLVVPESSTAAASMQKKNFMPVGVYAKDANWIGDTTAAFQALAVSQSQQDLNLYSELNINTNYELRLVKGDLTVICLFSNLGENEGGYFQPGRIYLEYTIEKRLQGAPSESFAFCRKQSQDFDKKVKLFLTNAAGNLDLSKVDLKMTTYFDAKAGKQTISNKMTWFMEAAKIIKSNFVEHAPASTEISSEDAVDDLKKPQARVERSKKALDASLPQGLLSKIKSFGDVYSGFASIPGEGWEVELCGLEMTRFDVVSETVMTTSTQGDFIILYNPLLNSYGTFSFDYDISIQENIRQNMEYYSSQVEPKPGTIAILEQDPLEYVMVAYSRLSKNISETDLGAALNASVSSVSSINGGIWSGGF